MSNTASIIADLLAWLQSAAPDAAVRFRGAADKPGEPGIDLHLLGLRPAHATHAAGVGRALWLDFAVLVSDSDPVAETSTAVELLFAVLGRSGIEVRPFDRDSASVDRPFAAKPGFRLEVRLERPGPERTAPRVREPLRIKAETLGR